MALGIIFVVNVLSAKCLGGCLLYIDTLYNPLYS
jgi:hypothetical protein